MDSSVYRHLLGQFKENCGIPHHNFPSHNLLSPENLLEISKDFNYGASEDGTTNFVNFPCYYQPFPYEVQQCFALFCGSGDTDKALELVKRKANWEKKLKNLKVSNINLAIKNIKEMRQNKAVKLTANLKKCIVHFHCDPEPMFSGNYNWLYTGGCLSCTKSFDGTTLISADFFAKKSGCNLIKLNETLDEVQFKSFCHLKDHTPVLQITSKCPQENLIFCVRQKNYLSLFSANGTNRLSQPVRLWRKKFPKILTCIDLKADCDEIIVTNSSHDINIFHVEKKNKIYKLPGKKSVIYSNRDSWSQIAYGDLGIYWACRNCLVILDMRDLCSGAKLQFTPSSSTNTCEVISSFVESPSNSNYVYLSTTHNVLQVDLREGKPVQRWTHLMKNPPQFMTSIDDEREGEFLVLQSQLVDEILGIMNERVKHAPNVNFVSRSLPCLLKSVKESLKVARFHSMCLSPFIAKRVDFTVTGMQGIKNNQGDINIFTHNSGGDIFISKIQKKTSRHFLAEEGEQEIMNRMKVYELHFEKFPFKESVHRRMELIDMRCVLKGVQRQKCSKAKTKRRKKSETYWKYNEMYSPESLESYRDVLAQKILKVWGHHFKMPDTDDAVLSVNDKVREWMEKY